MKKKQQLISRKQRAEECSKALQEFDNKLRDWPLLAKMLVEMDDEKLFTELGFESWEDWVRKYAPASVRLCYALKPRYKALSPHFTDEELSKIPSETAQWASKAANISPAVFSKPEVRQALMLSKAKAIEQLQESVPGQHIESEHRLVCKFAASQNEIVQDGFEMFRWWAEDEKASFETFIEWLVEEIRDSVANESGATYRDLWKEFKAQEHAARTEQPAVSADV